MNNSDEAIRELARKYGIGKYSYRPVFLTSADKSFIPDSEFLSDLTALIEEHYVEREEHDKVVQQRDELKEALIELSELFEKLHGKAIVGKTIRQKAEAAIKNTEKQ